MRRGIVVTGAVLMGITTSRLEHEGRIVRSAFVDVSAEETLELVL